MTREQGLFPEHHQRGGPVPVGEVIAAEIRRQAAASEPDRDLSALDLAHERAERRSSAAMVSLDMARSRQSEPDSHKDGDSSADRDADMLNAKHDVALAEARRRILDARLPRAEKPPAEEARFISGGDAQVPRQTGAEVQAADNS